MPRAQCLAFLLLTLGAAGCANRNLKAIVGATVIDGSGAKPLADSIIVIGGTRIRAVGSRGEVPVPESAEIVDGTGLYAIPGFIDLDAPGDASSAAESLHLGVTSVRTPVPPRDPLWFLKRRHPGHYLAGVPFADSVDGIRREFADFQSHHAGSIHLARALPTPALEALLADARVAVMPVTAKAESMAQVQWLVERGVTGFTGMFRDTGDPDPILIAHLRTLRIVFAPSLTHGDAQALRNARRLHAAGVPLALASGSAEGAPAELDKLEEAGLTPLEVVAAASHHSAMAMRVLDEVGEIEPGRRADIVLLDADPRAKVRNLRRIRRIMQNGQWVRR